MKDLADVTERARAIRRRRAAWTSATAAVLVVAATVGVIAATRNDDPEQLTTVTSPSESTPATDLSTVPVTGPPETTIPDTVVATEVTTPDTDPDSTADTALPDSTGLETTVNGDSSSTTEMLTTTTVAPPDPTTTTTIAPPAVNNSPIMAVNADGDAVVVGRDGATTLLFDGPDPDDAPPEEGESYGLDALAITDDGAVALVGTCCEPVVGSIIRYGLPDTTDTETFFGHAPAISPDGTKVALDRLQSLAVATLAFEEIATTSEDFLGDGAGVGTVWLDNRRFVVLVASPDQLELREVVLGVDNTLSAGASYVIPGVDGYGLRAAGTGSGRFYVSGIAPGVLNAFDSATMLPLPPSENVGVPGSMLSAWLEDGELRWVSTDRVLHIGDHVNGSYAVIPGEYVLVH